MQSRTDTRYRVVLPVLCSRAGRADFYAITDDVSVGGVRLKSGADVALDEVLSCRIRGIGAIDLRIVRKEPAAFVGTLVAQRSAAEAIVLKLVLKSREQVGAFPPAPVAERVIPCRPETTVTLANGEQVPGRILNVSATGARLLIEGTGREGDLILVGDTPANIVRLSEGGYGVAFISPLNPKTVNANLVL